MKRKNNNKKGFTIVELVIVIAVIAILAAVLIPTFSNIIRKANISNDTQIVRSLNTALAAEIKKPNTMHDALKIAEDAGFIVGNINAKANGNEIAYDSKNNVFCYYNADNKDENKIEYIPNSVKDGDRIKKEKDYYYLWVIKSEVSDKFSTYYTGTDSSITTTKGFDAGNTTVSSIDYTGDSNPKEVVIRTNGGTLTVNAPKDTVKHYGEADKVDVQAIFSASYHENGTVKLIAVKEGHVKLEGNAEVNGIYVYNETVYDENGDVVSKDNEFKEIKITVDAGVDVPKLSRSAVEIDDEGTKVCTVVTDQAKDVYLFNEGIYEQIKTVDEGKNVSTDTSAAWADSSANTATTQTAAQQLANEFKGSYDVNGKIADQVVEVTGDIAGTYTVKFNQDTREFETYQGDTIITEAAVVEAVAEVADVASEAGKTADEAQNLSALKGSGTEDDPWLITCRADMDHIQDLSDKYYYYKVKSADVDIDFTNWEACTLFGSFDGNGATFVINNASLFSSCYVYSNENLYSAYIKNLNINVNVTSSGAYSVLGSPKGDYYWTQGYADCICNIGDMNVENVNISGNITGAGAASYFGYVYVKNLTFKNCTSSANITTTSAGTGSAGFTIHTCSCENVYLINSKFIGSAYHTGNGRSGYWADMSNKSVWYVDSESSPSNGLYTVNFTDGNKSGLPRITTQELQINEIDFTAYTLNPQPGNTDTKVTTWYTYVKANKCYTGVTPTNTLSTEMFSGNKLSISKSELADSCTVTLFVSPNNKDNNGGFLSAYYSEDAVQNNGNWDSNNIRNFIIKINATGASETGISGSTFNIVSSYFGNTYGTAYVQFVEYSGSQIVSITNITISNVNE